MMFLPNASQQAQADNFIRQSPSETTSKSYNRAIKGFTEWANTTLTGPNKEIVTPKRLYAYLQHIDQSKRKPDGGRYSFSFYEQQVSSLVILFERQRSQFATRPKLNDIDEKDTGEWEHPRDRNVKVFLKLVKKNTSNEETNSGGGRRGLSDGVASQQQQQQQQQQQGVIEDPRIDSIEEHLRIQADSITRTNALLSLYHNDLGERSVKLQEVLDDKYDDLKNELSNLKNMINFMINLETKNQETMKLLVSEVNSNRHHHYSAQVPPVAQQKQQSLDTNEEFSTPEEEQEEENEDDDDEDAGSRRRKRSKQLSPEESIPKIQLRDNKDLSLKNLYDEYINGFQNQPSLKSMELKYKTRWRINGKNNKTIMRRLKVGQAIENASKSFGQSTEDIIKELDEYLSSNGKKKKSTYWLSENLPAKFH